MRKAIVQYWHDSKSIPHDIKECVASWRRWAQGGIDHQLFDQRSASGFIRQSLGLRYELAFKRCYHPAMQADYFRLCYLYTRGGFYVDADDFCLASTIEHLFDGAGLKLQPLCYDNASGKMVQPSAFLEVAAYDSSWIFYFNNNPLIVTEKHPVIQRALERSTRVLEECHELPEIQGATGPGNLSRVIFELGSVSANRIDDLHVLCDWASVADSRWPLSYRSDSRNWRLSNQIPFDFEPS